MLQNFKNYLMLHPFFSRKSNKTLKFYLMEKEFFTQHFKKQLVGLVAFCCLLLLPNLGWGQCIPDGLQNGAETGVDCGGPDCPACVVDTDCGYNFIGGTDTNAQINKDNMCTPCSDSTPPGQIYCGVVAVDLAGGLPAGADCGVFQITDSNQSFDLYMGEVMGSCPGSPDESYLGSGILNLELTPDANGFGYFTLCASNSGATNLDVSVVACCTPSAGACAILADIAVEGCNTTTAPANTLTLAQVFPNRETECGTYSMNVTDDSPGTGSVCDAGGRVIVRSFELLDGTTSLGTCTQDIVITDNTAPTGASANGLSTVSCSNLAVTPSAPADLTDNCGETISATLAGGTNPVITMNPAGCAGGGTVVWTYQYGSDCSGNAGLPLFH